MAGVKAPEQRIGPQEYLKEVTVKQVLLFTAFIFCLVARPAIKEAKTMNEALSSVDNDTVLIFDLDNTIIETIQALGSDQWVDYLKEKYRKEYGETGESEEAIKAKVLVKVLDDWKRVVRVTKVQPVEETTPELIRGLQAKGVRIMGLTARPVDLIGRTRSQLESVRVDLSKSTVSPEEFTLATSPDVDFRAKFSGGILHSGNNPKGPLLTKFLLEKLKLQPKKIVFVDDKKGNVESVEAALNKIQGLDHTSYRYGGADKKVAGFRKELAEIEWEYFRAILSDSAAQAILVGGLNR